MKKKIVITHSAQETFELGQTLARSLIGGEVLALVGNLGCGKTHFVKGLAQGLNIDSMQVRSPTFGLVQEHSGRLQLCHSDLYRLGGQEAEFIGLQDYWSQKNWVVAVEWADKAQAIFPPQTQWIFFEALTEGSRKITFSVLDNDKSAFVKTIKLK